MATGPMARRLNQPCSERAVAPPPQRVVRLLVLASAAMRPELVTGRCLDGILNEFRALKAVMH